MKRYKYPHPAHVSMVQPNEDFSTLKISPKLLSQIVEALKNKAYGSVEIFIENYSVTQITERTITKLSRASSSKKNYPTNSIQEKTKFSSNLPTNQ